MKKFIKSIVTFSLVLTAMTTSVIPAFAATYDPLDNNGKERVIQIAIPDENGKLQFFTGEEAQVIYNNLEKQTDRNSSNQAPTVVEFNSNGVEPRGMFTYKYRFVKNSSGTKWGTNKRISTYAGNATSVNQSKSISASTSVTWSSNITLSGKFNDVFTVAAGRNWQNTSSFSEMLTINVAPKKRVWLEFKPKLRYINGEAQKYYTTRGPRPVTIIEQRKSVSSTSPTTIRMTLVGKTFSCPDGAYIWKEDGNYNSY